MPRAVLLLVNPEKPDANAAAGEVRGLIERHGSLVGVERAEQGEPLPDARGADLIVVLGGDGTILSQVHRCAHLGVPLMGVNFGRLGFMAEFDLAALRDQAPRLFGDEPLQIRMHDRLRVRVMSQRGGNGEQTLRCDGTALNEAVVTAGPPFHMIQLELGIGRDDGPTIAGDGLIVSTSTGSTAYNLSAGGPIIAPTVEAVTITPLAPHTLAFRPIVIDAASRITIHLLRVNENNGKGGTTLVLDGKIAADLHAGDRVVIERNGRPIPLVANPDRNYWSTVVEKLHWAATPKMRDPGRDRAENGDEAG